MNSILNIIIRINSLDFLDALAAPDHCGIVTNGYQQQQALNHQLRILTDVHQQQTIFEEAHNEAAGKRTKDGALAALGTDPAQHTCRDNVKLKPCSV